MANASPRVSKISVETSHMEFYPYTAPECEPDCATSTAGNNTPTHTTIDDEPPEQVCSCGIGRTDVIETTPHPYQRFAIRERNTRRFITLVEGKLCMRENPGERGGWHWTCVETDGWLGFRNSVSSTYIGHNAEGEFWAEVKHHKADEYFCVRRHPQGGYLLLNKHDDKLKRIAVKDRYTLVETSGDGTRWDFIRV